MHPQKQHNALRSMRTARRFCRAAAALFICVRLGADAAAFRCQQLYSTQAACVANSDCTWVVRGESASCRTHAVNLCPSHCAASGGGARRPSLHAGYRVPMDKREAYVSYFDSMGWQAPSPGRHFMPGFTANLLSEYQRKWGISGAVGEIGVHHGAFFLSMALTAHKDEPLFALDIFDLQEKNIDRSGQGNLIIFLDNVKTLG
eukprot:359736-Chlamydomonas_euryale.AAC.4